MWPEATAFATSLARIRRRLRLAAIAHATLLGAAAAGAVTVMLAAMGLSADVGRSISVVVVVAIGTAAALRRWRHLTLRVAAAIVERQRRAPDNAVVTVEETLSGRLHYPHPIVRSELLAAALRGIEEVPPHVVQPLAGVATLAVAAVVAVAILQLSFSMSRANSAEARLSQAADSRPALAPGDVRVVITPPRYTNLPPTIVVNPASVHAVEGSRVRLEATSSAGPLSLIDLTSQTTSFVADGEGLHAELIATTSQPLLIRRDGEPASDRLITLRVQADERPMVRIGRPAQDLMFPDASRAVPIEIEARDDLGLSGVTLRYMRMSGSGETFTFQEGDWPVEITRVTGGHWTARATLELGQLKLADGDTLVYRAVASDAKPGADPAASDSFLIEIGRLAGVAATGFAVPDDRERQGLSQQMLILKTERLHADRAKLTPPAFLEQSRLLAIEQRMVKAEFVFMTGGEVADEVEEAAAAHELAEGRLENTAQVELLTAIREMSRAEARLNDANTSEALSFERAALRALQRAFDRRRYLLRTLPERARIDMSRRLAGEIATAKSSTQSAGVAALDPTVNNARELMAELQAITAIQTNRSLLASKLVALDPRSEELQQVALQLSTAREQSALISAARQARRALVEVLVRRLPASATTGVQRNPLRGRVADELTVRSPR